jgi:hypothetical protein
MQHNQLHAEYTRALADEHARVARERSKGTARAGPRPRTTRRRVAETLARLAWRLDREAALRVWP